MTQSKLSLFLKSKFSGFKSLCMIFFSLISFIPSKMPRIMVCTSSFLNFYLNFTLSWRLPPLKSSKNDVKRVFRFEDFKEPHIVWVGEMSHNLYFFDETLLSFLFTVSSLFWEGFYCVLAFVFMLFNEVNRSKVSFSDFV